MPALLSPPCACFLIVCPLPLRAECGFQCTVEELRVSAEQQIEQHHLLQYEQERYQDLFDFAPDGYLVTDSSGRILKANQAILELFGINHRLAGK